MHISWKESWQFLILALAIGAAWLLYAHGPEVVRLLRFGATPTPEVQAVIREADEAAKQAQAHAAEALRNQALAQEAAAGARDAVQKARTGLRGYKSQSSIRNQGETFFGYEGQVNENGSPEGLEVVRFDLDSRYEGDWKGGIPEGYGIMTYSGGRIHAGKWEHGVNVGDGITVTAGATWEGELIGSAPGRHGYRGVLLCAPSEACRSQAGFFEITAAGVFDLNGPGIVVMRDGRQLKSTWQHAVREGYGVVLDAKGGLLEQGNYRNGRL